MGPTPSGTVTFLFTDIEGSTRLWEDDPEQMRPALAEHDAVVRSAVETHGGYVFSTGGDGFGAAFSRAADAVDAAAGAQARLADHQVIRVRMGIHTGEVQERDGDYFGPAVNRAARLMALAHGGQVLVSATTEALLDESFELCDLGEHRLRDLSTPQQVFQLGGGEFGPVGSEGTVPNNLPTDRTAFVGRGAELDELQQLVHSNRLTTLCGVGGVGKTRLGIQLGTELLEAFPDGVWFVALAPLIDDALVPAQVLSSMKAPIRVGEGSLESAVRFLSARRTLVILDNCEHVLDATTALVETVLDGAPLTSVVATSREPLGVAGEHVFRVPSMTARTAQGGSGDAIELFACRAGLDLPLLPEHQPALDAVEKICRRLDGIPLAIELAAARANVLPIEQIADRLDERFRLLTRGGRTAVPRQQTLRGAIDWSYELLSDDERALFDALSVFAGGFDLAEAAAVGDLDEFDALDLVQQLVEKSMVEADVTTGRYRLLETLRQYGWERLAQREELGAARDRHAAYFAALVREQAPLLRTPGRQTDALDRLDDDYDNVRAALAHLIETRDAQAAERMVLPLVTLFNIRHPREGLGWFQAVIAIADRLDPSDRARLLASASFAAMNLGDVRSQRDHAEAAIDLAGDEAPPIAHVMEAQWHLWNDDAAACLAAAEAAPAVEADNPTMRLLASNMVVSALGELGREAEMRAQLPTIGALTDQVGSPTLTTASQFAIAEALETLGHSRESRIWWTKALQTSVAAEGPSVAAFAHIGAARRADGLENAIALYRAALPIVRDYLAGWHQSYPLVIAAGLAARLGHPRPAAQLIGHFDRAMHEMGVRGRRADVRDRDELCERLDGALGPDELARSLAEGAELTATQAIELALEALSPEGTEDSTSGALGADRPRTAG